MPQTQPHETRQFQGPARFGGVPGVLTITTHRILFTRFAGFVKKRELTELEVPLESVTGATAETRGARRFLVVQALAPEFPGPPRVEFEVEHGAELALLVSRFAGERRREAASVTRVVATGSPAQVSVSIHPPGPSPAAKVMVRCPYCRTVYPELDAKCPGCGAHF